LNWAVHLTTARVENYLNREVCRGTMPLAEAQRQTASDWLSAYWSYRIRPAL
jgi:hypothetical protein